MNILHPRASLWRVWPKVYVWLYWFSCKNPQKSTRCDKSSVFLHAQNEYIQQFAMWPCSPLFLQKTELRPCRLGRRGRFLNTFHYKCLSAFIFSVARHICLSMETFQKTCFAMSYWISKKGSKLTIISVVFLNIFK